ncbi:MAG: hypothetical protein R2748_05945 [Bryobacterales bacterium]
MTNGEIRRTPDWERVRGRSLLYAAAAGVVFLALAFLQPSRFLSAYLVGYMLTLGVALGALPLLMIHHLAGGGWGYLLRRPLEAATRTLPLMALLAIPLWFGQGSLYEWSAAGAEAAEKLSHKEPYLNLPFFVIRSVAYFIVWGVLSWLLNRASTSQDESDDPAHTRRLRNISGPGLIIYSLTMTFAAFDWVMSIEPLWYSTIFGVIVMLGQILTALSFSMIVLPQIAGAEGLDELVAPSI